MFIQIELYNWLTYILTQEDIKNIKTGYGSCNLDVLLTFMSKSYYVHIFVSKI